MLSAEQIKSGMSGFYGTSAYHRVTIIPGLVATDGVAWLCQNAECFWLIDEIARAQRLPVIRKNKALQSIQFWRLTVADSKGVLVCCEDEGKPVYEKEIKYTDFPLPEIDIWVGSNGPSQPKVAMLKSEY